MGDFSDGRPPVVAGVDNGVASSGADAPKDGKVEGKVPSAREKLESLENYLPGEADAFYDLAHFLAQYQSGNLTEKGFDMFVSLALYDLSIGKDASTGQPIINPRLAKQPPEFYDTLDLAVPLIKDAIFHKEK